MTQDKKTLLFPVLVIAIGVGWLLSALDVAPSINWIWTLSLGALGLSTLAVSGIDKLSVVVGPLFMIASVLSVLRQTGRLLFDIEVPILVIIFGLLLLVARMKSIPIPTWAQPRSSEASSA